MFKNPLLLIALGLTGIVAGWGIVDNAGLTRFASTMTGVMFTSRGWFVMLSASMLLLLCIWLAFSRYGRIKLGHDDDQPEFSTISWLTMLFAAGMGVGLLFWGAAEPLSHFKVIRNFANPYKSAGHALFITNFHWGLHAWAIYAVTGLVIAYFSFRKDQPTLVSAPMQSVFGKRAWTRAVGGLSDLLAIYAIAIGIGGSIAMGVFQIQSGVESLFGLEDPGLWLALVILAVLCIAYILPLTVDLSKGMATLSNIAMATAGGLMVFVLLTGPTFYLMNGITGSIGDYFSRVVPHGFETYTFFDEKVHSWFQSWTLTFMVWWFAWSPFVGVFIARISKGRTIREYLLGVVLVPTF
ncbi:MAG: BCCT family transporter, partial [Desulfobacterales bacterium]